jgi:AraC-like DNA-binding protein
VQPTETTAVRSTEFEISRTEAIEQFLVQAYGTSMRIHSDGNRHRLRHRRIDADAFAVETAYQSAELEFEVEPLNTIVVTRTATSRLERVSGRVGRRYGANELFLMGQPDQPYTARWTPGEIENCIIDPAMLARVSAAAPGRRPDPIRFTSLDPHSPAAAANWRATRSYVADLLGRPEAAAAPLVIASAARLLAAVTLATFPSNAVTGPTIEDRHDAHNDTLRRAVRFIEENAGQDITVTEIATAARVTVRAVQLAFRRHLDTTPMAYLRRVRLDHAHRDLAAADPGSTSVTAVAYRWGFASSSRFAAAYRQAYGVTPSSTLYQD